jgi:ClpP class serine protease
MELLAISREHINSYKEKLDMKRAGAEAFFEFFTEKKERRNLDIENGTAKISVKGVLGDSWWYDTEYSTIIELTKEAESNPEVQDIEYIIDSPGGLIDGLEETARTISKVTKPTTAIVKNMACSAGYWIASQCDKIEATNESAIIGSIGVMSVHYDYSKMMENDGVEKIKIVSSKAPEKNIDPATEKGYKRILAQLNKLHDIFVKHVAKGRKTTEDNVNENYGKGDVLISAEALAAGMIDKIDLNIKNLGNNYDGEEAMTGKEKTYTVAEFETAVKEAKEAGIKAERERVTKHLAYLGAAKNETLKEAIEGGAKFSECVEKYAEQKFAKAAIEEKIEENDPPKTATGSHAEATDAPAEENKTDVFEAHSKLFSKQ